jgi:hypothetical protein
MVRTRGGTRAGVVCGPDVCSAAALWCSWRAPCRNLPRPRVSSEYLGNDVAGTCKFALRGVGFGPAVRHVMCVWLQLNFLEFRDVLFPASGFQSVQFRIFEVRSCVRV